MIEVSIIIVNYNTGEIFKKCVDSILKTTKNLADPSAELILIDNASSDNSFQVPRGARTTAIRNKENIGFTRGYNQGIRRAKGPYVLLLNPDTVVKSGAIGKMVEFAQETEDVGAVGPRLVNPDGSVQASVLHFPTLWRAVLEFWLGVKNAYTKYAPADSQPQVVEAIVMAAYLITPAARKKVGLLDERYFMYYEDLDYCSRVNRAELKVYYLPSARVTHYHGVSGRSLADEQNQWRRLIPSSKIYHGVLMHYLINFVIWSGQKWQKLLRG